jgi:hypothetical protein
MCAESSAEISFGDEITHKTCNTDPPNWLNMKMAHLAQKISNFFNDEGQLGEWKALNWWMD